MAVQTIRYLRCDGCGVPACLDGADEGQSIPDQRKEAKAEFGWVRQRGLDLCESCAVGDELDALIEKEMEDPEFAAGFRAAEARRSKRKQ